MLLAAITQGILQVAVKRQATQGRFDVVDFGTDSVESVITQVMESCWKQSLMERLKRESLSGSGIGISIADTSQKALDAALCTSVEMAEMSRRHSDANVLAMGARMIEQDLAFKIVDEWLETDFEAKLAPSSYKHLD